MYPYMNEDVAWQRLQDLQREMENSRLLADQGLPALTHLARRLGAWIGAVLGIAWPARPADRLREEPDSASDAA